MARILFTWEHGDGLGHLLPHRDLLQSLAREGHEIHLAVRDLSRVEQCFPEHSFGLWQAPVRVRRPADALKHTLSMAHILHNAGYSDAEEIASRGAAWLTLIRTINPALLITDYSPLASFINRTLQIPQLSLETGFHVPPCEEPLPAFPIGSNGATLEQLLQFEKQMLGALQRVARRLELKPIDRVCDLFPSYADTLFRTLPELDHYPQRKGATYIGFPESPLGRTRDWPKGPGRKIYCYLKQFPALESFFQLLQKIGMPTVAVVQSISAGQIRKYETDTLRLTSQPVDLRSVIHQCDLAVTHGSHGTSAQLLLGGIPMLLCPLNVEQELSSLAIHRCGAGILSNPSQGERFAERLAMILNSDRYSQRAKEFQRQHAGFRHEQYLAATLSRSRALLGGPEGNQAGVD